MQWFKIFNWDHTIKKMVKSKPTLRDLISAANNKFGRNFISIVLCGCGTPIEDDDFLEEMQSNEILIALGEGEHWMSPEFFEPSCSSRMQNTSIPGIATDCGNEENNPVVLQMPQDFLDLTEICPVSNTDPISEVPPSNRVEEDTTENTPSSAQVNVQSKRAIRESFKNFENLKIPYDKMEKGILNTIRKKQKLSTPQMSALVHAVVIEIRKSGVYIPRRIFDNTAKQMCREYPDTFVEKDDDGELIGAGFLGLAEKFRNRNNYLNRPHMGKFNDQNYHKEVKNLRKNVNLRCGNLNNAPEPTEQYGQEREAINKGEMSIPEIVRKWTALKTFEGVCSHFTAITGCDISQLKTKMAQKKGVIEKACHIQPSTNILREQNSSDPSDSSAIEENPPNQSPSRITENEPKRLLKIIGEFFKENVNVIYQRNEGDGCAELSIRENDEPPKFSVLYDNEILQETNCCWEAFTMYFADIFVFCKLYPVEASQTLEFVQKYLLKLDPEGTKSRKRHTKSFNLKVLSLIRKIQRTATT